MNINKSELSAGVIFLAISLFFAQDAFRNLEIGTALAMGPAYFPLLVAGTLAAFGIAIIIAGVNRPVVAFSRWPWRGTILVLGAPILFAILIDGAGLAISIFVVAFITAFASHRMTLRFAFLLSIGLSIFCSILFAGILGLSVDIVGHWLVR